MSDIEDGAGLIDLPLPDFREEFRSFFDEYKKNNVTHCIFPISPTWNVYKKHIKLIKVGDRIVSTLSLADVHASSARKRKGRDVILYPSIEAPLASWNKVQVLRADYTEREDKVCAMLWAAHTGDLKSLRKLVSYGAYLDRQTENGNTVLMEALAGQTENRCKCIELLIKSGARTNLRNKNGHTLLTATAFYNDMTVLRLLHQLRNLKYSIDHKTKAGNTALSIAVAKQHFEMARFLVAECGANLLIEDNHQMTAACWAQVYCPPLAGYLCLQLGFTKELERFVLRRNEILQQLSSRAKQNKIREGDKELFGVIYGLAMVLLMLKPSRKIVVSKGMLNSLSNHPLWDFVLEEEDDALDGQILQLLPWFVALGCSMLYDESSTLQSFIQCGDAKRLITGLNDIVLECDEDNESRLMVQALVTPLVVVEYGRKWLYKVAFECASILKHFLDEDNFLEENSASVRKAFIMLMVANYAPYKMRDNYKYFNKEAIKRLCPEPKMTVGEKLRGALAYSEEVKQEAKSRKADESLEITVQQEEESKRKRDEQLLKVRMRKMKARERSKLWKQEKQKQVKETEGKGKKKGSPNEAQKKVRANPDSMAKDQGDGQHTDNNTMVVEERKAEDMYGGNRGLLKKRTMKQKVQQSSASLDLVWGGAFENATAWTLKSDERKSHQRAYSARYDPQNKERELPHHKRSTSETSHLKSAKKTNVATDARRGSIGQSESEQMLTDNAGKDYAPSLNSKDKKPPKIQGKSTNPPDAKVKDVKVQSTPNAKANAKSKVEGDQLTMSQFPPLIPDNAITVSQLEQMQQSDQMKNSREYWSLKKLDQGNISFFYKPDMDNEKQGQASENKPSVIETQAQEQPMKTHTNSSPVSGIAGVQNQSSANANVSPNINSIDNALIKNVGNQQKVLVPGAAGDQVSNEKEGTSTKLNWIPRSNRWKVMFEQLVSMSPEKREKVGSIHFCFKDESLYIARGSNGTVVSVGLRDDGMEVAVKRLVKSNSRCIKNELQNLRIPEVEHDNIVKYRDYVEDENFGYLALELCECTLEDYVHELRHSNTLHKRARRLVWQMLRGLDVLHKAKILHMDIKPRNVLIDVRGNVRLADFGISHRMEEDQSTVYQAGILGTRCWRPRESLVGHTSGRRPPYKTNSDVQVAGMVAYYVMTGGLHPYGQDPSAVELAIAKGVPKFREVHDETLINLMAWMLHPEMDKRKSAAECLSHPFFWTESKRFGFLYKVSQEPEIRDPTRQSAVQNVIDSAGVWLKLGDWRSEIDQFFLGPQMSLQNYSAKLSDLIRLMADVEDNFNTIAIHLQTLMGDPGNYFLVKFPKVFIVVYEIIRESDLRHRRALTDFFDIVNYVQE